VDDVDGSPGKGAPRLEPPALLPPVPRLSGEERDLLRRLRSRLRSCLSRSGGRAGRHRGAAGVAPGSEEFPGADAGAAISPRAALPRRADASLSGDAGRADRAPRRGRALDRNRRALPLWSRWRAPHRHSRRRAGPQPLGDEGGRGAPLQGVPDGSHPRSPADEGRAAAPASSDPPGAGDRARPRRDHRRDLPQRRRDRAGLPAGATQQRAGAAADGRGRDDGSLLRAGEPTRSAACATSVPTTSTTASTITFTRMQGCGLGMRCPPATSCAVSTSAGRW